jgi:hypothetical protein
LRAFALCCTRLASLDVSTAQGWHRQYTEITNAPCPQREGCVAWIWCIFCGTMCIASACPGESWRIHSLLECLFAYLQRVRQPKRLWSIRAACHARMGCRCGGRCRCRLGASDGAELVPRHAPFLSLPRKPISILSSCFLLQCVCASVHSFVHTRASGREDECRPVRASLREHVWIRVPARTFVMVGGVCVACSIRAVSCLLSRATRFSNAPPAIGTRRSARSVPCPR